VDDLASPHWSPRIQDEWGRNLLRNDDTVSEASLARTCALMNAALPDAMVREFEPILARLEAQLRSGAIGVDPKGLHVLAAAIMTKATIIITENLKDFPPADLRRYGIQAITGDDFLMSLYQEHPNGFLHSMHNAWKNLRKSMPPADVYIRALADTKLLPRVSDLLAKNIDLLVSPPDDEGSGSALDMNDADEPPAPAGR